MAWPTRQGFGPNKKGAKFIKKVLEVPSRELTYPPTKGLLKMILLFPRWDMLIPWRVIVIPYVIELKQQQKTPAFMEGQGFYSVKLVGFVRVHWRFTIIYHIGSMGLVYLPAVTINLSHSCR